MAGFEGEDSIKLDGLNQLLKALKVKPATARIGILGGKSVRSGGGSTNAEVGAAHEFGTEVLPQRSFLRVPISEHLQKEMEKAGALKPEAIQQILNERSLVPWLKKIAVLAEGIVAKAFDSGGYSKWPPSDMTHKLNKQTLVETQQLRNSISSEVRE